MGNDELRYYRYQSLNNGDKRSNTDSKINFSKSQVFYRITSLDAQQRPVQENIFKFQGKLTECYWTINRLSVHLYIPSYI